MSTAPFYHGLIRRYHLAFGALFDNIAVIRVDADNAVQQKLIVPIEYTAKESWFTRQEKDVDGKQQIAIVVPRLAYQMTALTYDVQRKLNEVNGMMRPSLTPWGTHALVLGKPYIMSFELSALTRSMEDANLIVEQIVPVFGPDYTVTVRTVPSLGIADRMRIVLDGVTTEDSYEADGFTKTRNIITTFHFRASVNIYAPTTTAATPATLPLIRKVMVDLYGMNPDGVLNLPAYLMTDDGNLMWQENTTTGALMAERGLQWTGVGERLTIVPDPADMMEFPVPPSVSNTTVTVTSLLP